MVEYLDRYYHCKKCEKDFILIDRDERICPWCKGEIEFIEKELDKNRSECSGEKEKEEIKEE